MPADSPENGAVRVVILSGCGLIPAVSQRVPVQLHAYLLHAHSLLNSKFRFGADLIPLF
jgi:hypothetical protein